MFHAADDGKAHALNGDFLADGGTAAEELVPGPIAEKSHVAALLLVLPAEPTPLDRHLGADLAIIGAHAAQLNVERAVLVADPRPADELHADAADGRRLGLGEVDVFLLELDAAAGALAAGLHRSLARKSDDGRFGKVLEQADHHVLEAVAIGQQKGDGGDAPDDAEHGEETAGGIAQQADPGLDEDLSPHGAYPPASQRSASTGSTEAAREAG